MKSSLIKLQKVFKLEAERGYDNHAVVGGLERMFDLWEAEARLEEVPEELIRAIGSWFRDYSHLSEKSRAEALQGLWKRIQRSEVVETEERRPVEPEASHFTERIKLPKSPTASAALEPVSDLPSSPPLIDSNEIEAPAVDLTGNDGMSIPAIDKSSQVDSSPSIDLQSVEPAAVEPLLVKPTALVPTAVEPTAISVPSQVRAVNQFEPAAVSHPTTVVRRTTATVEPAALLSPVTVLQGVGPRIAQNLSRLGLNTLRDMLYHFPRRYDDFSRLKPINRLEYGEEVTVIGMIKSVHVRQVRSGKAVLVEALLTDGSGTLRVSWFNQTWISKRLHEGMQISVAGKVEQYLGRLVMTNPEMEPVEEQQLNTNRIVPVYPLTATVNQHWLRKQMSQVINYWAPRIMDPLPDELRSSAGVMELPEALLQIHFPENWEALKAARERLSFDEILLLQLGVLRQKRAWQERSAVVIQSDPLWLESQIHRAPFKLTGAQRKAIGDIAGDLASGRPMNRLIQGDVGSGKTFVAAMAVAIATLQGGQASFMAPTSLLAEQHYRNLLRILAEDALTFVEEVQAVQEEAQIVQEELPVALEEPPAAQEESQTLLDEEDSAGIKEPAISVEEQAISGEDQTISGEDQAAPGQDQATSDEGQTIDLDQLAIPIEEQLIPVEEQKIFEEVLEETPVEIEPPPGPPPLRPDEIRLLVGSTSEAEKTEIRSGLESGQIRLVIGTHALIEDPVVFQNLQLVIVDEQHRFGVEQRGALRSKGTNPHLLVMTATPIPRSLALTVYGDLDLTVMDEMPPGRQPVSTHVLTPRERERAYTLIRSKIAEGQQIFIIYPLIEESENSESRAAVAEYERLKTTIFPNYQVGLLHGKMRPEEKDAVMASFRSGEYQVLVSTTVIEVGVDIPNATVMLIEGANRFGLAQLHQLRGRVGRGAEKSYCLLIPDKADETENERLQVMTSTTDGFVLAERDLEQRGPGQFLGTRQAGFDELKLANLMDVRLIEKARHFAAALFGADPDLSQSKHRLLASSLQQFWDGSKSDIS